MVQRNSFIVLALIFALSPIPTTALSLPAPDDFGTGTPEQGIYCPSLSSTFQKGARDTTTRPQGQVSELQAFITSYYNLDENVVVGGYFGNVTHKYVVQFQGEQGLPTLGIVGSLTRAKIAQVCGGGTLPIQCPAYEYMPPRCGPGEEVYTPPQTGRCPMGPSCRPIAQKCGVNTFGVQGAQCGNGGYSYAYYQCYDGFSGTVATTDSCAMSESLRRTAESACAKRCANAGEASISITSPDSGQTFYLGDTIPLGWRYVNAPANSQVVYMVTGVNTTGGGLGGGGGQSEIIVSGSGNGKAVWKTGLPGSGYTDIPGTYEITMALRQCDPRGCSWNADFPDDPRSVMTYAKATPVRVNIARRDSGGITVTAPNGGEQWEVGTMNTITWTPYGYNPNINPSSDITAYLVPAEGSKEKQRIVPSGKASIHWEGEVTWADYSNTGATFAEPGRYRVQVVNNKTGAQDTSDAAFTIVPRSVDLKINGLDGPLLIDNSRPVTLSWSASNVTRCEIQNAYTDASRQQQIGSVSLSGTREAYLHGTPGWGPTLYCYKKDGSARYDSVQITGQPIAASARVLSPNGGETLDKSKAATVKWTHAGLRTYSVALYKNDQWFAWINKDMSGVNVGDLYSIDFNPEAFGVTGGEGAVWKIYVTGQKADGSGYVDDKSDMPFSFTNTASASPSCSITTEKSSYTLGEMILFTWTSSNASYAQFVPDTSGKDNLPVPGDKLSVQGTQQIPASVLGNPSVTLRVTGSDGQSATCSKTVVINPAPPTPISPYTVLFMRADSGFTDLARGAALAPGGDARVDTTQSRFGGGSVRFDGSGDRVSASDNNDYDFGSGDFTVDFWVRFADVSDRSQGLVRHSGDSGQDGWSIQWNTSDGLAFYAPSAEQTYLIYKSFSPSANTWYHVAVVRSGSTLGMYLDGMLVANSYGYTEIADSSDPLELGQGCTTSQSQWVSCGAFDSLNGWIDDLRITKGVALWTSNFSPASNVSVAPQSGAAQLAAAYAALESALNALLKSLR